MNVHVEFYSRLRELAGQSTLELALPEEATIAELLEILYIGTPELRQWDKSILVASGVEFVNRTYKLKAGDQISIMPPVQGG
jgi:molybdopterin converting factor small subunit